MWRKWPAEQTVLGNAGTLRIDSRRLVQGVLWEAGRGWLY